MRKKLVSMGLVLVLMVTMVGIMPGTAVANDGDSSFDLVAETPAGVLLGKLLLIIDGIMNNFVRWENAGSVNGPVWVISGLTDKGKTLVEALGDLILDRTFKALSESEEDQPTPPGPKRH